MADDFNADELLMVLDQAEKTGAPPHLVERIREVVRLKADETGWFRELAARYNYRMPFNVPYDELGRWPVDVAAALRAGLLLKISVALPRNANAWYDDAGRIRLIADMPADLEAPRLLKVEAEGSGATR